MRENTRKSERPLLAQRPFRVNSRRRPTFPRSYPRSSIGPEELNCRVRNGNGCFLLGKVTGKPYDCFPTNRIWVRSRVQSGIQRDRINTRHYGQAERPISTSQLKALQPLHFSPINVVVYHGSSGRSHLEVGFPLICFQRLSFPDLATRRCRWRDNRYTRGRCFPVLSY